MIQHALKNLWTQPVRSALCVVGITIAIVGVVCIFSFSAGLKSSVQSAIHLVEGVVILQKNRPDPTISSVPLKLEKPLEKSDQIKNVVPWIWTIPGSVEHRALTERSVLTPELLGGVDVKDMNQSDSTHLYQRKLTRGRFLKGTDNYNAVISERLAARYSVSIGETLTVEGDAYRIVGTYKTGNKIMDMAIIMPMERVRSIRDLDQNHVSDLFISPADGVSRSQLIDVVEQVLLSVDKEALEKWDVRSRDEWESDFSDMMNEVDLLLFLISSLAVIVGGVGIINTMLMSITERTSEFGILIANGWAKIDIVRLVLCESTILGIVSGIAGTSIGWLCVTLVNLFFDPAMRISTTPTLLITCFVMTVLIGVFGGVYPAYRAANKNPIDAIRSIR